MLSIAPIGGGTFDRCETFASGLADVIRALPVRPLLVISSDMNHFASDAENRALDEIALHAMEQRDPAHLLTTVHEHGLSARSASINRVISSLGDLSP